MFFRYASRHVVRRNQRNLPPRFLSIKRILKFSIAIPGVISTGVYYALGGTYVEQRKAITDLIAVFAGTLAPVTIGLWITRTELNISSMMGMTMIVGIATEVAIFYVSELVSLSDERPRNEALVRAGINRIPRVDMIVLHDNVRL